MRHRPCRSLCAALLLTAAHLAAPPIARSQVEETGTDDFRISAMGGTGDTNYRGIRAAIAYNSVDHEYLVVWRGDHTTPGDDKFEIFGQRIHATTGAELGSNDFQISEMSSAGFTNGAHTPDVAYNPTTNQYLVVWSGKDDLEPEPFESFEIWGQRIDGATGDPLGGDFLISDMGTSATQPDLFNAVTPAVAYNSAANEYLVVWSGDDDIGGGPEGNEQFEIWGQRLDGDTGTEAGAADDFRISSTGGTTSAFFDANRPAVAYNEVDDEYLVAWDGDDGTPPYADNELEIWVQRLDNEGAELGGDVRITSIGPTGNSGYLVVDPEVAYSPDDNEYLVVFTATANLPMGLPSELEIFAQRLDGATGAEVGTDDVRITDVGGTGETTYDAEMPDVAYSTTTTSTSSSSPRPQTCPWGCRASSRSSRSGSTARPAPRSAPTMCASPTWAARARPPTTPRCRTWRTRPPREATSSASAPTTTSREARSTASSRSSSRRSMPPRAPRSVSTTSASATWDPSGTHLYQAHFPALASDAIGGALVVWEADDNTGGLVFGEYEMPRLRRTASGRGLVRPAPDLERFDATDPHPSKAATRPHGRARRARGRPAAVEERARGPLCEGRAARLSAPALVRGQRSPGSRSKTGGDPRCGDQQPAAAPAPSCRAACGWSWAATSWARRAAPHPRRRRRLSREGGGVPRRAAASRAGGRGLEQPDARA